MNLLKENFQFYRLYENYIDRVKVTEVIAANHVEAKNKGFKESIKLLQSMCYSIKVCLCLELALSKLSSLEIYLFILFSHFLYCYHPQQ